jgi:hypothetical protein
MEDAIPVGSATASTTKNGTLALWYVLGESKADDGYDGLGGS